MEELENSLKKYFLFLGKHCLLWESAAKKASKSLCAIENLADQLQSASSTGPDVPINIQFPDLKQQIIYKTLLSLEQELIPIMSVIKEISEATDNLNKLSTMIYKHDVNNFAFDTVSLRVLLESVHDTRQYYQAQYAGLQTALRCLDFRDSNSIFNLRKCLIEDKDLKRHAERCLLFGKYFLSAMNAEEIF
ncbi:uncharacterized protein C1orf109-like [Thrips palmi]|uniref:Uncharacterized protein C1orf109-like n=1 Tax=Thrips palmi TaxID=161013 RepID=A0A6P8ZWG0_THRPL|nr:uncharacterized protein C1orf109-like [Thrips palmi]XP_034249454.1 uncharacterized protein C1orf109-like [Thrips palmi]XP_034249455.1 uncharacterized protein C1orf109-like [Thrips palmi]